MTRYLGNTTAQQVVEQYSFVAMVTVYKQLYLNVNINHVQRHENMTAVANNNNGHHNHHLT